MAHAIERSRNFIHAINTANFFTEFVDGTFKLEKEKEKLKALTSKIVKSFLATAAFGVASVVTVPWEIVSRVRHGQFALRGYGFLCPALGLGAFALFVYYLKSCQNQERALNNFRICYDISANVSSNLVTIRVHTEQLFQELKSTAQKPETLPLLIHLHYLKGYCQILANDESDMRAKRKDSKGHYPSYTKLFTINAEYLRSSSEKQAAMLKKNITLVTTPDGKCYSVTEAYRELGLTVPTSQ